MGDRLIVEPTPEEQVRESGLIIPDAAKEKPQRGRVKAAGPGIYQNGKRVPLSVKKGDEILFSKYGGVELSVDGKDVLVLREADVLARVKS